jgi:hypothetical protein
MTEYETSLAVTMARHVERKAISLQIHNLSSYQGHKKSPPQPTQFSLSTAALVDPLCEEWGIPSVCT